MEQKKYFKIQSIMILLIVMILQMVIPIFPIALATEIEGEGTKANPWNISKTEDDNVTAYIKGTTLHIEGTGEMCDFESEADHFGEAKNTLTRAIIDEGITNIGENTFRQCTKLARVDLPEGLTSIGSMAFADCRDLRNIDIPEGVTEIKGSTFLSCTNLVQIRLPETITQIGAAAFFRCQSLKNINIPYAVTSIGEMAFGSCKVLENIKIPAGIEELGEIAFDTCNLSKTNVYYYDTCEVMGNYATNNSSEANFLVIDENILINIIADTEDMKTEYTEGEQLDLTNLKIEEIYTNGPAQIVTEGYTSTPQMDEELYEIGQQPITITYNEKETSFNITVNEMEHGIQQNPWDISMTENDHVTAYVIGTVLHIEGTGKMSNFLMNDEHWDRHTRNITEVVIDEGIENIGKYAFYGCVNLKTINFPSSLTTLNEYAFTGSYFDSLEIPATVTNIGIDAFAMSYIKSVTLPSSITSIPSELFANSLLESITISSNITEIGSYAFYYCSNLKTVNIEEGLTAIGKSSFQGCTGLKSIDLPESLLEIKESAFLNCTNLKRMVIPEGVTTVKNGAFNTRNEDKTDIYYYEECLAMYNYAQANQDEANFMVLIGENALIGIDVNTENVTLEYTEGEELNLEGLVVQAVYLDGSTEEIEVFTTSPETGEILNVIGQQKITVEYMGKTASFYVTVSEREVDNIIILNNPDIVEYTVGDTLDITGLRVGVKYKDNPEVIEEINESDNSHIGYIVTPLPGTELDQEGNISIKIEYRGKSVYFNITVEAPPKVISGITADTENMKTEYFVGEHLNLEGLKVEVVYTDDTTEELDEEEYEINIEDGALLEEIGEQEIEVSYMDYTDTFTINVLELPEPEKVISGITADTEDMKTEYFVGEHLNLEGLKVEVVYTDDTTEELDEEEYEINIEDGALLEEIGEQEIEVNYMDYTDTFTINVLELPEPEKVIAGITVDTEEMRTEYFAGEYLNLAGLKVEVIYTDDTTEELDKEEYEVNIEDGTLLEIIGEQEIVVSYMDYSDTFTINVSAFPEPEKIITGITVDTVNVKTEYFVGEHLNLAGLKVEVVYTDDTKEELDEEEYEINIEDGTLLEEIGEQEIEVSYMNHEATFTINVSELPEPEITGITVNTEDMKTEYFVGEHLNLAGLKVEVVYTDDTTEEIDEYETSLEDGALLEEIGEQEIAVSYMDYTDTFTINVLELPEPEIEGIRVNVENMQIEYTVGEHLNLEGLKVEILYTDNTKEEITEYETSIEDGALLEEIGEQEIVVSYMDYTEAFSVMVNEREIENIIILQNPDKTEYIIGELLDTTGLRVGIQYKDNPEDIEEIFAYSEEEYGYILTPINGTKLDQEGKQNIIVEYKEVETSFQIMVQQEHKEDTILKEDDTFEIVDNYIENIPLRISKEDFAKHFNPKYTIIIDDEEKSYIGTGTLVTVKDGTEVIAEFEAIVYGDLNNDGVANIEDIFIVNKVRLKNSVLQGAKAVAADVNLDGAIDILDIFKINKYRLLDKENSEKDS